MATLIRGTVVTLYERREVGRDPFGAPIYEEVPDIVRNVLVTPVTAEPAPDATNLTGMKTVYELSIPKGDAHQWEGGRVVIFGKFHRVVSPVKKFQEELLPLDWNKKVQVERYV